ncbi:MAG: ABC transporter permease, partial [Candidatus Heimdallarchaeaceae archaeon]
MSKQSLMPSVQYAFKSIRRNFRRSFTLMLGIIISISIISGVLFYLDSTSGTLVSKALADVTIDTAIVDTTANETLIREILDFTLNESDFELINSADLIVGTKPFMYSGRSAGKPTFEIGAIVAPNDEFDLSFQSVRQMLTTGGNFSITYVIGLEPSYFEHFSLFSTTANVTEVFGNGQVLISENLEALLDDTDNVINVTIIDSEFDFQEKQFNTLQSLNLTVGGVTKFDTAIMQESIYAFEPDLINEGDSAILQSSLVPNVILMDYEQYWSLFNSTADKTVSFNAIHIKEDHSLLSDDTETISSQINQIANIIGIYYPEVEVVDLLNIALDSVDEQLNQMRLFLIYFALPGLLLGAFISKYAIDLTLKERQKEIGLLRTKATLRRQIAFSMGFESTIISSVGLVLGLLIGYIASLMIYNGLNGGGGLIAISGTSIGLSLAIGVGIVSIAVYFSTKQLLKPSVTETLKDKKDEKVPFWRKIYLDYILIGVSIV